jgi:malate dehydrogenase (oxaloacetate-decarboxylating)(NADP+)
VCRLVELIPTEDIDAVLKAMNEFPSILEQYSYLSGIQAKRPGLFYASLFRKPDDFLPIVYTPGVGKACQNWGRLTSKPEGLTLALSDCTSKVEKSLRKFAEGRAIDAVVVTDGTAYPLLLPGCDAC